MAASLDEVRKKADSVGESVVTCATQHYCECIEMLRNVRGLRSVVDYGEDCSYSYSPLLPRSLRMVIGSQC